jgi:predicted porin
MKKSILALAVLAAFGGAAHAQSSVTIYGAVDASLSYTNKISTGGKDTGGQMALDSGLMKGSRLGVKGVEDLGGGIKALFTIENGSTSIPARRARRVCCGAARPPIGLSGNFGTIWRAARKACWTTWAASPPRATSVAWSAGFTR